MKTLFDSAARQEINTRLASLRPDAQRRWGTMTVEKMLAHLTDGIRSALGQLEVKPKKTPLRFAPVKKLVIYYLPFPKGAPTAPELVARTAVSIDAEVMSLNDLMEQFGQRAAQENWPLHAAFGKMSRRDWGVLQYRHIDHHLRQFGA